MRRVLHLGLSALLVAAVLPGAASATGTADDTHPYATACAPGVATDASASRPHLVDPAGDGAAPWGTIHGSATDVRAAWLGFERDQMYSSSWRDLLSQSAGAVSVAGSFFTLNLRVADLSRHPANGIFYVTYAGSRGTHWVQAAARYDAGWDFSYGYVDTSNPQVQLYTELERTAGVVDTTEGTISLALPASEVPARRTDGKATPFQLIGAESRIVVGSPEPLPPPSPVRRGSVQVADAATNNSVCPAFAYPAEEPSA